MPEQIVASYKILWTILGAVYTGITGHQYFRMNKLEDQLIASHLKIESNREKIEDSHVSKEMFEAHMEMIQISLTANTKLSDANTKAIEKLFDNKEDKKNY